MAIECIRDLLKLDQAIGEGVSQALVEGEATIPEDKAAVARILDVGGDALISSCEVIQDKVMIEGVIHYDILYVPDNGGGAVETTEADIAFTHYLDVPGAKPKMGSRMKLAVEHMDYELISGRKLSLKSVLDLEARVEQTMELEALSKIQGIEDVEVLSDHIHLTSLAGSGKAQTMLREDIELADQMPSVVKIIRRDVKVRVNEKKAADNKVIAHGDLQLKLLYICDDPEDPIHLINRNIPFSHFVEIPGAYQGMDCEVDVNVSELYVEPKENINDEMRIVDIEAILAMEAKVYEAQDSNIIVDAYSPSTRLGLRKRKVNLKKLAGESQGQTVVKQSISFPEGVPQARKILYVDVKPVVTDEHMEQGKVVFEGLLSAQFVYQVKDESVSIASFKEDVPFRQVMEVEGAEEDMECRCQVSEEHTSFVLIAPDEVELKAVLSSKAVVHKSIEKELLIGVDELENTGISEGGIYVYFVQPGDSLWSIAKRYNTTIGNILKYNELDEKGPLKAGSKLIIFKKLQSPVA